MKKLLSKVYEGALFGVLVTMFSKVLHMPPIAACSLLVLLLAASVFVPNHAKGAHSAGIAEERWQDYIQKRFFRDNQFMNYFDDHNRYVNEAGNAVHIPNRGAKPTVNVNPSSWPLTVEQRSDTVVDYTLDYFITSPTQVTNAEEAEVSYSKMDDVMGDHMSVQSERAADMMLIKALTLLPSAKILKTTGGSTAVEAAPTASGQTGNRLVLHPKDIKRMQTLFNIQDIPQADRYAILESNCLDQLTEMMSDQQWNAFNQYFNEETGMVGKLYGFKIFDRSRTAIAANAYNGSSQLVVDAYGATVDATDQLVNLFWHKSCIARAMGEINVMHNEQRPEYGGDIMNCDFRFGGSRKYADATGVGAIMQASAA